ncbi:SIS domain-containing protein [Microbacterium dextranolyticum]|uniref:Fructosamine deglycase FrlB n=1 Tax=Microbacterium dextranolyticum TaxID=36806 RepID=A0A9W6HL02_9MICO|nr:SIS domain-containing protein [Microbacterium dextranolyticum]MBM7464127.1 fructoselysine 6-phosphate deglycase [Microbacterium dextranolyticum]GLJ95122.1 fructosamine deglycase FrlB [Microbacterium dextranolyticum]
MTVASTFVDSATIEEQLATARAAIADRETVSRVVLTACGGSFANMQPNEYFLGNRATTLESVALNAAEFTSRGSSRVDADTVVILCSHSGTTPETVAAAAHARSRGALTVAFTFDPASPLAQEAEYVIAYQHGDGKSESYVGGALILRLVAAILDEREGASLSPAIDAAVAQLPVLVPAARAAHTEAADAWAFQTRREPLIYTMAAGSNYGTAYSFAICLLQEMQWVHSAAIHAGEYFHGPFEVTDVDVPFIALLGLDETRPVEQRAVDFLTKHTDRALVIDAKEFGLDGVAAEVQGVFAHLLFNVVLRTYADALADHRGHPLSVRRYMWRMEY